jgi:hypothetical protein
LHLAHRRQPSLQARVTFSLAHAHISVDLSYRHLRLGPRAAIC